MKVLFGGITAVSAFILLGTVGAMDTNSITVESATLRMCIWLPIMVGSFIIAKRV